METRSRDLMRMDRRLLDRPGWITPAELESQLSELPDVADKIDNRESDPSGEDNLEPRDRVSEPVLASPPSFDPPRQSGVDGPNSGGVGGGGESSSSL